MPRYGKRTVGGPMTIDTIDQSSMNAQIPIASLYGTGGGITIVGQDS